MAEQAKRKQIGIFISFLFIAMLWILKDAVHLALSDWVFLSGNLFLIVFSLVRLVRALRHAWFSFSVVHWTYIFFFFGIAPFVHVFARKNDWVLAKTEEEIVLANLLLILWCLCYAVAEEWIRGRQNHCGSASEDQAVLGESVTDSATDPLLFRISVVIALVFLVAACLLIGIPNPLSKGDLVSGRLSPSSSLGQFIYKGHIGSLVFATAVGIREKRKTMFLLAAFILFFCSPIHMSRYLSAVVYIGLVSLWFYDCRRKEGMLFSWLLCGGLLIAFPFLDVFRYGQEFRGQWILDNLGRILTTITKQFEIEHYDGWSMTAYAIRFAKDHGITWGWQMLGTVLFWVPRSLWSAKPIGSGAMIIEELYAGRVNPSCPMPVEGFINFGIPGTILLAIIVSVILTKLDLRYHTLRKAGKRDAWILCYPFLIVFYFFCLRGDGMSSTAYLVGFIFPALLALLLCGWIRKPRKSQYIPSEAISVNLKQSLLSAGNFLRRSLRFLLIGSICGAVISIMVLWYANEYDPTGKAEQMAQREIYVEQSRIRYEEWQQEKAQYENELPFMDPEQKKQREFDVTISEVTYDFVLKDILYCDDLAREKQELQGNHIFTTLFSWGISGMLPGAFFGLLIKLDRDNREGRRKGAGA